MENDMTRIAKPVLVETLSAKDDLIPPSHMAAYTRARKEWESIATTNAGKFAVISAAQVGEENAKLFLLFTILNDGRIKKTLWRFLGPSPVFQKARIAGGDSAVYRSLVAEALEEILEKWDQNKVTAGVDYFVNLKMQVANRVKTNTRNYNTEQNRFGMGGKILAGEKEPEVGSYDLYTTGSSTRGRAHTESPADRQEGKGIESHHDAFSGAEDLDAWQTFVDDQKLDSGPSPTTREILKYFLENIDSGFDAKAAGQVFGKTHVTIYGKLKSMKDILETHGISFDAFLGLMQVHGAKSLAETL